MKGAPMIEAADNKHDLPVIPKKGISKEVRLKHIRHRCGIHGGISSVQYAAVPRKNAAGILYIGNPFKSGFKKIADLAGCSQRYEK